MSLAEQIKEKAKEQRDELQKHLLWDITKKHSSVDGNVAQRCISELEDEVLKILSVELQELADLLKTRPCVGCNIKGCLCEDIFKFLRVYEKKFGEMTKEEK